MQQKHIDAIVPSCHPSCIQRRMYSLERTMPSKHNHQHMMCPRLRADFREMQPNLPKSSARLRLLRRRRHSMAGVCLPYWHC